MKLPEEEKAAYRAAFRAMSPAKKAEHIYTYYKWPILLGLVVLLILGSALHRALTEKQPVFYLAFANVTVGSELEEALTAGYLDTIGADARRQEVYLYRDLYLSPDADEMNHEYAYASQMKAMGAIQAQKMDLVLMNREVYDLFSRKGYLAPLPALLEGGDPALAQRLTPLLTGNEVVLSDNTIDFLLGEAEEEQQVTQPAVNALSVSSLPLFQSAGFDGEIYIGVLANTPRSGACLAYLSYLCP